MKRIAFPFLWLLLATAAHAQAATPTPKPVTTLYLREQGETFRPPPFGQWSNLCGGTAQYRAMNVGKQGHVTEIACP